MTVYAHTEVFARVVSQTVQLSNNKGRILVSLMPSSQEDATLGYKYNQVKLQAQSLCMLLKKKKKVPGQGNGSMETETKNLLPKQKDL